LIKTWDVTAIFGLAGHNGVPQIGLPKLDFIKKNSKNKSKFEIKFKEGDNTHIIVPSSNLPAKKPAKTPSSLARLSAAVGG
jgi:hypothetical protein